MYSIRMPAIYADYVYKTILSGHGTSNFPRTYRLMGAYWYSLECLPNNYIDNEPTKTTVSRYGPAASYGHAVMTSPRGRTLTCTRCCRKTRHSGRPRRFRRRPLPGSVAAAAADKTAVPGRCKRVRPLLPWRPQRIIVTGPDRSARDYPYSV